MAVSVGVPKYGLSDDRLWHYRAKVVRVIDGDTVVVLIDKGFGDYRMEKLRLAGVNTPELRPRAGNEGERAAEKVAAKKAKARVEELLNDQEVVIRSAKTGKFGRWIAHIYLPSSRTRTINQLLLDEGLATIYPARK